MLWARNATRSQIDSQYQGSQKTTVLSVEKNASQDKRLNNKPVGGMLRRHLRTLESPKYLYKELDDVCIRLLLIRRFRSVNSQDVGQGTGDQKTHVLVLVLKQPILT